MRDISTKGAGFESSLTLARGQALRYRWGNEEFREAEVSWFSDGRFGVSHSLDTRPNDHPCRYAYRSVRVPKKCEAAVYVAGERIGALLSNFSQRGIGLRMGCELTTGTLVTLRCGGRYFEGASVRWTRFGVIGFNLATALSVPDMESLALVA